MDRLWETQRISSGYDDHLRYLDTSRPKKRRRPDQRDRDLATSVANDSSSVPAHESTAGAQPNGPTTTASVGKRKREEEEANMDPTTMGEDLNMAIPTDPGDPGPTQHPAHIPMSSDAVSSTEPAPSVDLNFYLHHPSLPSRHTVLIPVPPDAKLATLLTNRIVLEFPTLYVLRSPPDGALPEGYVSEEDFFDAAKKELIEEVAVEEISVRGLGGKVEETKVLDVEDGEVDEGRLLEVLGKDLKGVAGSL